MLARGEEEARSFSMSISAVPRDFSHFFDVDKVKGMGSAWIEDMGL